MAAFKDGIWIFRRMDGKNRIWNQSQKERFKGLGTRPKGGDWMVGIRNSYGICPCNG